MRVVCREGDPRKPDFAVTRGTYEGIEVSGSTTSNGWAPDFEWTYKNGRVHELFERELVAFKPDIVHIHHLTGLSTTIVETIKAGGLPLVMTLHDFWTVCPRGQRITKELDICEDVDRNICFHCLGGIWPQVFHDRDAHRTELDSRGRLAPKPLAEFDRHMAYILNLADVLIAPSWFHRERMLDFPIDPDRIVALPHGLDPAPFRAGSGAEAPTGPEDRVHRLGDPDQGRARPGRRVPPARAAGSRAPHPRGRVRIPRRQELLERLQVASRSASGTSSSTAPTCPPIFRRSSSELDILVVPSLWWETFCLTIREGQLAGVPVIASDLGAMREALDGEECGLLFQPATRGARRPHRAGHQRRRSPGAGSRTARAR